jgi:hypothetical protein
MHHFLPDAALGSPGRRRVTPRMARLIPELGTAVPFRRAVRILGFPVPGIQPVIVWAKVRGAGEQAYARLFADEKRIGACWGPAGAKWLGCLFGGTGPPLLKVSMPGDIG